MTKNQICPFWPKMHIPNFYEYMQIFHLPPFIKIIFVTSFYVFSAEHFHKCDFFFRQENFFMKKYVILMRDLYFVQFVKYVLIIFLFFLDILYQIRRVSLEDKSYMYCLWIAKDSEDCTAASRLGTLTLANSNAETIDDSLGEVRIQIIIH